MLAIGVAATFDSMFHWLGAQVTVWVASLFMLVVAFFTAPSGGFLLALPALCGVLAAAMGLMRMEAATPPQPHAARR